MENRREKRFSINLPSHVSSKGMNSTPCILKDFCLDGGLIEGDGEQGVLNGGLFVGDEIVLHLKIPSLASFLSFQIQARVVRLVDAVAAGIVFSEPDPAALQALNNYVVHCKKEKTERRENLRSNDSALRIYALCRRASSDSMLALLQRFFHQVEEELLLAADNAKNNLVQIGLMSAVSELKSHRRDVVMGMSENVLSHFSWPENSEGKGIESSKNKEAQTVEGLDVVSKDDFEDWLLNKVMISKAESNYAEALYALCIRFSSLLGYDLGLDELNVAPAVFCNAFSEEISTLHFELPAEKIIYDVFEKFFMSSLGTLYEELNSIMIDSGICPDIDHAEFVKSLIKQPLDNCSPGRTVSIEEIKHLRAVPDNLGVKLTQAACSELDTADLTSFTGVLPTNERYFDKAFIRRPGGIKNQSKYKFNLYQKIAREAYSTAIDILNNIHPDDTATEVLTADVLSEKEVMAILVDIQKSEVAENAHIGEVVRCFNSKNKKKLSLKDAELFVVIDKLFKSVLSGLTNEKVIEFVFKLKPPVSKLIYMDDSFCSDQIHPARLFLNRVAELDDVARYNGDKNLIEKVEPIVDSVVSDYDQGVETFERVLSEINALVDAKNKIYERNLNRVIEVCDGQQRLISAKTGSIEFLEKFCLNGKCPAVLPVLLDSGLKELLLLAHLNGDSKEKQLNECASLIGSCIDFYLGYASGDSQQISNKIIQMVDKYIQRGVECDEALVELDHLLLNCGENISWVDGGILKARFMDEVEQAEAFDASDAEYIWNECPMLRKALVRAQSIAVDDQVDCINSTGVVRLRLIWVNTRLTRFIFVNGSGIKNYDVSLIDLVRAISKKDVQLVRDLALPAVEQGLESLVQDACDQIKYQTGHDELTGLPNRKEFFRLVSQAVQDSRENEEEYVVCNFNLDQFKVINNTCGMLGGDQLLQKVAGIMEQWMPAGGVLARLGGDEFGVLLKDIDVKEAYSLIENQAHAIETYRFDWKEKVISLTVSVGVSAVNNNSISATAVLEAANEACISAKEAGRNIIQVFHENDDQLVERNDMMMWVTQLNQALDEDRLHLRGQKISAVADVNVISHYEILLTVEGPDGSLLPPVDFIHAAEKYNRMQAVDRWVIKNVFEWLHDNEHNLESVGGVAINLSGHSMNDSHMLEYIFDLFVKFEVPRDRVMFEVTETAAISNLDEATDFINEMRNIGCKFALDDFGSGLSSYAYLKHLPVDYVKIDGVFIKDIVTDKSDYAMVKSINEMAQFLGMKTIAEYVENGEVLDLLKEIGVNYAQGYGVGKPVPIENIIAVNKSSDHNDLRALF
ncbi:MAG: DUF1631 family protein [Gammaproteobacteria bacterium]|nr:DUF1631 family protein [Gammaproteobacteria bacterium]